MQDELVEIPWVHAYSQIVDADFTVEGIENRPRFLEIERVTRARIINGDFDPATNAGQARRRAYSPKADLVHLVEFGFMEKVICTDPIKVRFVGPDSRDLIRYLGLWLTPHGLPVDFRGMSVPRTNEFTRLDDHALFLWNHDQEAAIDYAARRGIGIRIQVRTRRGLDARDIP